MPVKSKLNCQFFAKRIIPDELQIAIPTRDGKRIAISFRKSPYLKIFKIINRKIRNVKLIRKRPENYSKVESYYVKPDTSLKENGVGSCKDCQVVIIRRIDHHSWNELGYLGIEVIQTDEKEIDQSVQKYIEGTLFDKYNNG